MQLRDLLFSGSVLSKQFIVSNGLFAVIIDDNHLYDEEGRALVSAFNKLDAKTINWCNTAVMLVDQTFLCGSTLHSKSLLAA